MNSRSLSVVASGLTHNGKSVHAMSSTCSCLMVQLLCHVILADPYAVHPHATVEGIQARVLLSCSSDSPFDTSVCRFSTQTVQVP